MAAPATPPLLLGFILEHPLVRPPRTACPWVIGVSQNRPMLFDLDGRERKLGLGIKKKNAPMGRGGVPPYH